MEENDIMKLAKEKAKAATREGTTPQIQLPRMRSTTLNIARAKHCTTRGLPDNVGRYSKRICEGRRWRDSAALRSFQWARAVVRLLLDRGADVNAEDKYGRTALGDAAITKRETMVQLLLDRGADLSGWKVMKQDNTIQN